MPAAVSLRQALESSPTLAQMLGAARRSEQTYQRIAPILGSLASEITPGRLQGADWSLLVPNAAVGTKLRQILPEILLALQNSPPPLSVQNIEIRQKKSL